MDRILVTGATGFVGRHLLPVLAAAGYPLTIASRRSTVALPARAGHRHVPIAAIGPATDWRPALEDCRIVVHLGAQVPGRGIEATTFDRVNAAGTQRLAEQAAEAGVRLFVLLSSIFAVTHNAAPEPVDDRTAPVPHGPYGRSKLAAEAHVRDFATAGRIGVSLRPPVVYGAGAGGNWRLLQQIAAAGLPLPFAGVANRRSLIAVQTLADAIAHVTAVASDPRQSGSYTVADATPVSLSEIIAWLRQGMDLPPRLFPFPAKALQGGLSAMGRGQMAQSLFGDLVLDASRFGAIFDWTPPLATRDGIVAAGRGYRAATASGGRG
jgi:UDP-glucose 4-epimerase